MRFKEPRLIKEYEDLSTHNGKMQQVLAMLDVYCNMEFGKDVCITRIFSTQAEHDALYAQTPEDKRPKSSPHLFWKGVDIRSTDFTDVQKKKMLAFLNCFTYKSGQGRPVAILHNIAGNVEHFHIQID